jgi:hypothetical protein
MQFTFDMSENQANMIFKQVSSHIAALKNWTASAVERGDFVRAQSLVAECREYERLYAAFNIEAKREYAEHSGKKLETSISC